MRIARGLLPCVTALAISACAVNDSRSPIVTEGCPMVLLTRSGGLGFEWQTGLVAAMWKSGKIIRADDVQRPWEGHVDGRVASGDVEAVVTRVHDRALWESPTGTVALDSGDDTLTLRRESEIRHWAETPGETSTPAVAEFRAKLASASIDGVARVQYSLEDVMQCVR